MEGTFKLRKIFTSRSQIPADQTITNENPFAASASVLGGLNINSTATTVGILRQEDVISSALSGQRIEVIPKNFDYSPQV